MKEKKSIFANSSFQTVLSSIFCIIIGLFIGYLVLLLINPSQSGRSLVTIILNFWSRSSTPARIKALGNTLIKASPLLMCSLSVCFCYKVGLFNIGAAGQYEAGAGLALYSALAWNMPWWMCLIMGGLAGALLGCISGALKAYRNVNEVISGIMLNWITLYLVNMILTGVKDPASPYTKKLAASNSSALIPSSGLGDLFAKNRYITIAVPLAVVIAILIQVILNRTRFGYELKATGFNKEAARYAGMREKKNIIVTLAIGGALAGIGAGFLFLTGYQEWSTTQTSVPSMGFNGIAATFLGGLSPIGSIFSSLFIQQITDGGALIDKAIYPSQISDLISAIIVYLCGFVLFFRHVINTKIVAKRLPQVNANAEEDDAPAETPGNGKGGDK